MSPPREGAPPATRETAVGLRLFVRESSAAVVAASVDAYAAAVVAAAAVAAAAVAAADPNH